MTDDQYDAAVIRKMAGKESPKLGTINPPSDELYMSITDDMWWPHKQGILPDHWIKYAAENLGMIEPFVAHQEREGGVISYGLSSFGYDLRAAPEWKWFSDWGGGIIDPKSPRSFDDAESTNADSFVIPPNDFVLTRSVEYLRIPSDVMVIAVGKSTYARAGIFVGITPLEPGWEGHVTIELANTTQSPVRVHGNEGIVQLLFFKADRPDTSYADRAGKYQGQTGITLPKV